eukprot:Opistho-2@47256
MASVERRLLKELAELRKTPATEFTLEPNEENILTWTAKLNPPAPSLYQGGTFEVKIVVPSDYPIRPPKMTFVTRICHPNIHFKSGEICLDILKTTWSPAWTLRSTCLALLVLLDNPEVDSPLNCDAGMSIVTSCLCFDLPLSFVVCIHAKQISLQCVTVHMYEFVRLYNVCVDLMVRKSQWKHTCKFSVTASSAYLALFCKTYLNAHSRGLHSHATGNLLRCGDDRGYRSLIKMFTKLYAIPKPT